MSYAGRELFREGPAERGYCSASRSPEECERAMTKTLSGYSYGRGHAEGGLGTEPAATGALHMSTVSAALPGGHIELATVDAALSNGSVRRLRATLLDAQGLFFCRDTRSGELVAPFIGMLTRACAPDAVFAVDAGLLAVQWDLATDRVVSEWVRLGPALELLGNGLGYAHALRSIEVGVPFDVRSIHDGASPADSDTTFGAGLRISALLRTPRWEARASARHRTALAGGAGALHDNNVEGELLLLHNFFLSDALVMQAGVALRASYGQAPRHGFAIWASLDERASAFAGVHLGWVHEPPRI